MQSMLMLVYACEAGACSAHKVCMQGSTLWISCVTLCVNCNLCDAADAGQPGHPARKILWAKKIGSFKYAGS